MQEFAVAHIWNHIQLKISNDIEKLYVKIALKCI